MAPKGCFAAVHTDRQSDRQSPITNGQHHTHKPRLGRPPRQPTALPHFSEKVVSPVHKARCTHCACGTWYCALRDAPHCRAATSYCLHPSPPSKPDSRPTTPRHPGCLPLQGTGGNSRGERRAYSLTSSVERLEEALRAAREQYALIKQRNVEELRRLHLEREQVGDKVLGEEVVVVGRWGFAGAKGSMVRWEAVVRSAWRQAERRAGAGSPGERGFQVVKCQVRYKGMLQRLNRT